MVEKILIICPNCSFSAKVPDSVRGRKVKCPQCTKVFYPSANEEPSPDAGLFNQDRFLFKQKFLQTTVHKQVFDQNDQELFFVEEPRPWLKKMLAWLAWAGATIVVVLILAGLASLVAKPEEGNEPPAIMRLLLIPILFVGFSILFIPPILAFHLVAPKFNIKVYTSRGEQRRSLLMTIRTEHAVQGFKEIVVVEDNEGRLIGQFTRNWLLKAYRGHWKCLDANGRLLFSAKEAPAKSVFFHRAAWVYCFIPVVRGGLLFALQPGWEIDKERSGRPLARYRPTIEIDWSDDEMRSIDRRLCLSLGLILDSGYSRLFSLLATSADTMQDVSSVTKSFNE